MTSTPSEWSENSALQSSSVQETDEAAVQRFHVKPDSIEKTLIECDRFLKLTGISEERRQHLEAMRFRLSQPHNSEMTNDLICSGIAKLIASSLAHPTYGADPDVVVDPKAAVIELRKAIKRNHGNKRITAKLQKAIKTKKFGGTYQLAAETTLPSPLGGVRVLLKKPEQKPLETDEVRWLRSTLLEQEQKIMQLTADLAGAPKEHDELLVEILKAMTEMTQRLQRVEDVLVPVPQAERVFHSSAERFGARFSEAYDKRMRELKKWEAQRKREDAKIQKAKDDVVAAIATEQKRIDDLKKKAERSKVSAQRRDARSRTRASSPSASKRRSTPSQRSR